MLYEKTAIILIGYQNDYFSDEGILHDVIEESSRVTGVLSNTVKLIEHLKSTPTLIISTPIIFTSDYSELVDPVGILKVIKDKQVFKADTVGAETIPEIRQFDKRITEISGKRGLNAFSNTILDEYLKKNKITNVIFAGTVVSICIDSTARAAFEKGYKVSILSDCTSGRTVFEQKFYCENIFPIYAKVITHQELINALNG